MNKIIVYSVMLLKLRETDEPGLCSSYKVLLATKAVLCCSAPGPIKERENAKQEFSKRCTAEYNLTSLICNVWCVAYKILLKCSLFYNAGRANSSHLIM